MNGNLNDEQVIGIDLGGTHLRAGIVNQKSIADMISVPIPSSGTVNEVLEVLFGQIDQLVNSSIQAIGIGVPSVVDVEKGIVYDVINIPSWKKVDLKEIMEDRYRLPVLVNNDANCFALGEKYFGKGRDADSMIGLSIGTGIGAGIIIHNKLYTGINCGAGEFGEAAYLDHNYEYYASGQFFQNFYGETGKGVFEKAQLGDEKALMIFQEFGKHVGNAIKMILFAYDPQLIIIGGSIKQAYSLFEKTMWQRIHTFTFPKSLEHFAIEISELEGCSVLGAAALYYDQRH